MDKMKEEQKCISLELAKELQKIAKENKFELPDAENLYARYVNAEDEIILINIIYQQIEDGDVVAEAYDISELGKMLPEYNYNYTYSFKMSCNEGYSCVFIQARDNEIIKQFKAENEAECRGKMLCYLIKNKIL